MLTWTYLMCIISSQLHAKVTDQEYALMPPVFHYDDYSHCMMLGNDVSYCTATIELFPTDAANPTRLWKIIEEESRPEKNYKHNKLRYGVCLWQSCNELHQNKSLRDEQSLKKGISECYTQKYAKVGLTANVTEIHVQNGGYKKTLDKYDIPLLLFTFILGLLISWGTIYECFLQHKSKEGYSRRTKLSSFVNVIGCFSLKRSWKILLEPFPIQNASALIGIQGIRCFTTSALIYAHTVLAIMRAGIYNTRDIESILENPTYLVAQNNAYHVQTFFVISAWLLSYDFFVCMEKKGQMQLIDLIRFAIRRYLRLTPCLIFVIMMTASTWNMPEPGPLSYKMEPYRDGCRNNWWANLLYINNYYDVANMCANHTWYIAADFQLYILSLIVLGVVWKIKTYTTVILATCLLIAIVVPGIINYVNDYVIVMKIYPEYALENLAVPNVVSQMYFPAHTNMGATVLGLIFGYMFYKTRNINVFTNKIKIFLWYILVICPPLLVMYLGILFFAEDYVRNRLVAALYATLGKNAMAFSMALFIYGISQGVGWIVRDLLAWRPFQVLGKVCYCAYMFHYMLFIRRSSEQSRPTYFHLPSLVWRVMGDLTGSFIIGLTACLCIELPFHSLQNLLIPRMDNKHDNTENGKNGIDKTD